MIIKGIRDEDFTQYKKPSMFVIFPSCSWKCEKECGERVCQNSALAQSPNIEVNVEDIVDRYIRNPITSAIVIGGLEPFDNFMDLLYLIEGLRNKNQDDIVIYTGYTEDELETGWFEVGNRPTKTRKWGYDTLKQFPNITVKFGRYIPNQQPHFDEVLGVSLISDNQYARRIS